jgi:hypothetical protein
VSITWFVGYAGRVREPTRCVACGGECEPVRRPLEVLAYAGGQFRSACRSCATRLAPELSRFLAGFYATRAELREVPDGWDTIAWK